ncbi:TPA: hypothetical protein ACJT8N_001148 [Legionella pneumophila]|nr:hypothetical protein [Legionella pneumophila]
MKNSEVEDEVREEKLSDLEVINFTEWLIFKIKIIYSRSIFEGDNPTEASAIRQEWQDLVRKIGKQGVLGTIDYLLSGHHSVPSFPPSTVEFRKCYRTHVAPTLSKLHVIKKQKNPSDLPKEQNQEGYKQFQELLKKLKPSYLVSKRE